MFVQAKKGVRCPKENKPREYITDREPEDVPGSAYYLRLIADGSLVEIAKTSGEQPPPTLPPSGGGREKVSGGQSKKGGKE